MQVRMQDDLCRRYYQCGGGAGDSDTSSEATDDETYFDQPCSDDDDCSDGVEAGSVACIYTQLLCVTAFFVWMTSNVPSG
jgi:hypothetical protein